MCKISVVVAVYQAEKYIRRCLESLRKQTLREFEVLLIDDGSTDKSGEICDEYANHDNRFKVFHKVNGGVSSARQMGLDNASGEYIIHVDPDDWTESNMLEEMYDAAKRKKADLVICDFYLELGICSQYCKENVNVDNKQFFYDMITNLHGACWNKLVRKECFVRYNISFPKEMIMWEDKYVNLKLAENPIMIEYLPKAFYHYDCMINKNSAVSISSRKKIESERFLISWLDKMDDPNVKIQLMELKRDAKKVAFLTKEVKKNEFCGLYPEVNRSYSFKLSDFGRSPDFYIWLALNFSFRLSRILYLLKITVLKYVRLLWQK